MNNASGHDETDRSVQEDLREQIAAAIQERGTVLVWDTVAIFPYSGTELLDSEYCNRIGEIVVQMLLLAIRTGKVDPRGGIVADLHRVALERSLLAGRLFTFVYLFERSTLDELALHDSIGATSEAWPLVAQVVRRGSFDLVAAYTERAELEPSEAPIVDKLTTLHTR